MSDLEQLKKDNRALQNQLEQVTAELERTRKVERDLWSHEIYLAARKKMLGGVLAIIGVLSALGLLTVWEFYTQLKTYTQTEAKEFIASRLSETLPEIIDHEVDRARQEARRVAEAAVNDAQQVLVVRSAETARISVAQATIQAQAAAPPPNGVESAETFYVIAGSSPMEQDLTSELARVEKLAASDPQRQALDIAFPNLKIAPPNRGSRNFALVVGGPLPRDAARELRDKAIDYNFRDDTFLWPVEKAYFVIR